MLLPKVLLEHPAYVLVSAGDRSDRSRGDLIQYGQKLANTNILL
jgi:hypothetical protein